MTLVAAILSGAIQNLLVLLGVAFICSRLLRQALDRRIEAKALWLGLLFSGPTLASMAFAFSIAPGVYGDFRTATIGAAALIGGPIATAITAASASFARIIMGGHWQTAIAGIAISAAVSIGYAAAVKARHWRSYIGLALLLALSNAAIPLFASWAASDYERAIPVSISVLVAAALLYPPALLMLATLSTFELRQIAGEANLRAINSRLEKQERRFQSVFDISCVAMCWEDLHTRKIIRANRKYCEFTGYAEGDLLEQARDQLVVDGDQDNEKATLERVLSSPGASLSDERRYRRKDGSIAWGRRTLAVIREDGEPRFVFAIVEDITARKDAAEKLSHMAHYDGLTALLNRTVFERELATLLDSPNGCSVLLLDLDDFKEVNDALGHAAGDELLFQLADRLRECAEGKVCARFGGDEFAIVFTADNATHAALVAHQIIRAVSEPFVIGKDRLDVSASIGVAFTAGESVSPLELLKRADIALYEAKRNGKGNLRVFEGWMEAKVLRRQQLKADLLAAVDRRQFELAFQPIFSLERNEVISFEALLRWRHPTEGYISPAEFIPAAEDSGCINQIGSWVLRKACEEAMKWPASVCISVNVSPRQFGGGLLPLQISRALMRSGLAPERLCIEITESVLIERSADNKAILRDIKNLGVKIALDDFGIGYSSLSYVQHFPFDKIKIDRSFLSGDASRLTSDAVIAAVVALGTKLGIVITAEGIETCDQLNRVSKAGCHEGQGYKLGKPMTGKDALSIFNGMTNRMHDTAQQSRVMA